MAPGEIEKARTLVASAEKHCIVSNSLRAPVTLHAEISVG